MECCLTLSNSCISYKSSGDGDNEGFFFGCVNIGVRGQVPSSKCVTRYRAYLSARACQVDLGYQSKCYKFFFTTATQNRKISNLFLYFNELSPCLIHKGINYYLTGNRSFD